jgi:hypothetical protein
MIEISNVIYDPKLGEIVTATLSMTCLLLDLHDTLVQPSSNISKSIRKGNFSQQMILLFQIQKKEGL